MLYLCTGTFMRLMALCTLFQAGQASERDHAGEGEQNSDFCGDKEKVWWYTQENETWWVRFLWELAVLASLSIYAYCSVMPCDCSSILKLPYDFHLKLLFAHLPSWYVEQWYTQSAYFYNYLNHNTADVECSLMITWLIMNDEQIYLAKRHSCLDTTLVD